MSDAAPEQAVAAKAAPAPRVAWPEFAAARAWPEGAPSHVALAHHRDGTRIHVLVEPAALPAYRALAVEAPMPEGARVVAWHESPAGALLDGYLLHKSGGIWAARVISAEGALPSADTAPCLRCHDMAPTDHLFGPPGAAPQAGESIDPAPR